MGTSLSGLTPATTFDGLLKTSDNEPLDGTLKAISTGDGTDTILSLSNSALQIGGDTEIDSSGLNALIVKRNGSQLLKTDGSGLNGAIVFNGSTGNIFSLGVKSNDFNIWDGSYLGGGDLRFSILADGKTGIGAQTPTAQLHVKGSGATSATTSLLVQNSAGTELLKVTDDGAIDFGVLGLDFSNDGSGGTMSVASDRYIKLASSLSTYSALSAHLFKTFDGSAYSEAMRITGNTSQFVGIGETTPTARLHIKGSGNDNTTTSLLVQNSDGDDALKVTDDKRIFIGDTISDVMPSLSLNGFASFAHLNAYSSIDLRIRNNSALSINSTKKIGINTTTPTAQLQVKGSGATSATTALLVQNSAGTEHLKVTDDGEVNVRQVIYVNHETVSSRALRLGWGSIYGTDNSSELSIGAVLAQAATAPRIILGGKTRASGADAIQVQTLNGMYIATTAFNEDPSAQLHIKGSGNDATTTALLVQNSDATELLKINDDGEVFFGDVGKDTKISLRRSSAGSIMGSIEAIGNGFYLSGYQGNSNILFGRSSTEGITINNGQTRLAASLGVKGLGATSATTALLVENSAGTELLKVRDDGWVDLPSTLNGGAIRANVLQVDSVNFKVDGTNNYFQSQFSKNIFGADNTNADASAVLQADSTTQGFLPPRMTTAQRDAITTPAAGLMVYNTTTNKAQCYNGTAWQDLF